MLAFLKAALKDLTLTLTGGLSEDPRSQNIFYGDVYRLIDWISLFHFKFHFKAFDFCSVLVEIHSEHNYEKILKKMKEDA